MKRFVFVIVMFASVAFGGDLSAIKPKPFDIVEIEKPRILKKAELYLNEKPRTVTSDRCPRSAGGQHDYYSEGDYWWPDPKNPDGPYGLQGIRTFVREDISRCECSNDLAKSNH